MVIMAVELQKMFPAAAKGLQVAIKPLNYLTFIYEVLVVECAVQLIQADRSLDYEDAYKILMASTKHGYDMFPDDP